MIQAGTILGKYTVEGLIGGGGFGLVYRATQRGPAGFVQEVAIKTVHPGAGDGLAALVREARIIAQVHHRNVVQVHDLAHEGAIWFLVMEYVEGVTLRALRDRKLPLWVRVGIGAEVAAGLEYAHELRGPDGGALGLIHRDVKPSNILLGRSGTVKLADFGLAKLSLRPSEERTEIGVVKGTPAYMSPEQRVGEPASAASDVFSLAAVLHELVTGVNPATLLGDGRGRECLPSIAGRARPEADEGTARALETILTRSLAVDPSRRPSAHQLGEELRRIVVELAPASNPGRLVEALARCVDDALGLKQAPRSGDEPQPTQSLRDPDGEVTASASPGPSEVVLDRATLIEPPPPPADESQDALEEDLRLTRPAEATRSERRTWLLDDDEELRRTRSEERRAPYSPPPRRRRVHLWQLGALVGACAILAAAGIALALLTRTPPLEVSRSPWPDARPALASPRLDLGGAEAAAPRLDAGQRASAAPDASVDQPRPRRPHGAWARRKVVRRDREKTPPVAPPAGVGWLSLNAEPWAHVYLDGRRLATTPIFRHPLAAGPHVLRLVGANRRTATRSVTILPDRHLNLGMIPLDHDR